MFNGFSQGLAARKQNDSNVIYTRYLQYSQRRAPRLWLRVKALVPRVTVTNRSLQAFGGGSTADGPRPPRAEQPAIAGKRHPLQHSDGRVDAVAGQQRHGSRNACPGARGIRGLRVAPRSSPRRPATQTPAPRPSRGPGLGAAATGPGAPAAGRPSVRGHGARGHGLPAPPDGSGLLICISEPPPGRPVPAPRRPPPPPPPGEGTR